MDRHLERKPVRGQLTTVRPVVPSDLDWLVAAHADPEVSRYWDDETYTRAELEASLGRPGVDGWIVEAGGERVGYLQSWWEPTEQEPDEDGVAGRKGGLDMFLVPAARGRGLGPDAGRALAAALLEAGWASVTVDPYAWNERAVRAWLGAGFAEVSRHPPDGDHSADWILMRFELHSGR